MTLDRRVRRTRRALKGSLLELLREKPYPSITVTEILERADVGRSTFYAHYGSKEDLLLAGFEEWLQEAAVPAGNRAGEQRWRLDFVRPLLVHMMEQRGFALGLLEGSSSGRIRTRVEEWIVDALLGAPGASKNASAPVTARARCVAAALLGLAEWWLRSQDSAAPGGRRADAGNAPGALTVDEVVEAFVETVGGGAEG